MKKLRVIIILGFCLYGVTAFCMSESPPNLDVLSLSLITSNTNLQPVVWINGEPTKVVPANSGTEFLLKAAFRKGENEVWVTTEAATGVYREAKVKILEANFLQSGEIVEHMVWQTSKGGDRSPTFTYMDDIGLGYDTSMLEDLNPSGGEIREVVSMVYTQIEAGLREKNISKIGIRRDRLTAYEEALGVKDLGKTVFGSATYHVKKLASVDELKVKVGECTIFAYNPTGRYILEAGPKTEGHKEGVYWITFNSIRIGRLGSNWVLIY